MHVQIKNHLPRYEILLYFIIYGIFLLYGIANIYSLRDDIVRKAKYRFSNGWSVVGRKRDDSNDEWENFKNFLWINISWYLAHISLSECFRFLEPKLVPVAHALQGLAFVLATYRAQTVFTISCQLLSFYVVSRFRRKSAVWLLACIWIAVINTLKNSSSLYQRDSYVEYYELIISLSWCILKCLSFSLSKIQGQDNFETAKLFNFVNYCGYCLYFPTFIYGPFMIFDRYAKCLRDSPATGRELQERGLTLLENVLRLIGCLLLIEFALHFTYVFYLEQNFEVITSLNPWALYGFGYLMGQFFHCQYIVTYGVGIVLARFERIDAPNFPKCIGRIHFYTDMWKYFDQGLYEFLFRYIYASLCLKTSSLARKMFASIVTFGFIFLWHGIFDYVLVWSTLNFLCLTVEKLFRYLINSPRYIEFSTRNFSCANRKRIYAILGSQVFIPSAISNFYFFAGIEVGNYFMSRTYRTGIIHYVALTICSYCIFQSADFINEKMSRRKKES